MLSPSPVMTESDQELQPREAKVQEPLPQVTQPCFKMVEDFFWCARHGDTAIDKYFGKLDLHITDALGMNALHHAVVNGHIDVINSLCKQNIDVNKADYEGNTPLHHIMSVQDIYKVSEVHRKYIARQLLLRGAKVLVKNIKGEYPRNTNLLERWLDELKGEQLQAEYVMVEHTTETRTTLMNPPQNSGWMGWLYQQLEVVIPSVLSSESTTSRNMRYQP